MKNPDFDGDDYVSERDKPRLTLQIHQVRMYMEGARWLSVKEISAELNHPEPSVSAQIRNNGSNAAMRRDRRPRQPHKLRSRTKACAGMVIAASGAAKRIGETTWKLGNSTQVYGAFRIT